MYPTSVIALFCDDIREEKSGALTLVGVMGDNANMPGLPEEGAETVGLIPRIGIYIRVNFDVSAEIGPVAFTITMPDGQVFAAGGIDEHTIEEAKSTRAQGNPMAGVISRMLIGGIMMRKLGRMTVEATIGEQKYVAGFLNFISEGGTVTPSTVLTPPP